MRLPFHNASNYYDKNETFDNAAMTNTGTKMNQVHVMSEADNARMAKVYQAVYALRQETICAMKDIPEFSPRWDELIEIGSQVQKLWLGCKGQYKIRC